MANWQDDRSFRRPWLILAVAGVLILLVALVALRLRPMDADPLKPLAAIAVGYPGSVSVREGDQPVRRTVEGTFPAQVWRHFESNASIDEVLAYYRDLLRRQNWQEGGGTYVIGSIEERRVCAWHRDDLIFRLGFWDAAHYQGDFGGPTARGTVYEVRVIAERRSDLTETPPCVGSFMYPEDQP